MSMVNTRIDLAVSDTRFLYVYIARRRGHVQTSQVITILRDQ